MNAGRPKMRRPRTAEGKSILADIAKYIAKYAPERRANAIPDLLDNAAPDVMDGLCRDGDVGVKELIKLGWIVSLREQGLRTWVLTEKGRRVLDPRKPETAADAEKAAVDGAAEAEAWLWA